MRFGGRKEKNRMVKTKCAYCGRIFEDFACHHRKFCSCFCSSKFKIGELNNNWKGGRDIKKYRKQHYKDNLEKCKKHNEQWYKDNREKAITDSKQYYEDHREIRLEQERQRYNRTHIHTIVAEEKLGRKLRKGERVHHKDMDHSNNSPENLYIYKNQSEHNGGHASLYPLVADLLRRNIIEFKGGKYYKSSE